MADCWQSHALADVDKYKFWEIFKHEVETNTAVLVRPEMWTAAVLLYGIVYIVATTLTEQETYARKVPHQFFTFK